MSDFTFVLPKLDTPALSRAVAETTLLVTTTNLVIELVGQFGIQWFAQDTKP